MKSIKNIREFAEANGISRQVVEHRIKSGWKFGVMDGKRVMYQPKYVQEVK
jgi:hypothetical protein